MKFDGNRLILEATYALANIGDEARLTNARNLRHEVRKLSDVRSKQNMEGNAFHCDAVNIIREATS
jgi:hypothetical protein